MGFLEVLTLIFVALKLMNYIDWSWWAVLSPFWGAILLYIVIFSVGVSASLRKKK